MEELIVGIARRLVDFPDEVQVNKKEDGDIVFFELCVNGGDLGKVIGKQGRTIRAMRTLLAVRAAKERRRVQLEIAG